MSTKWNRSKSKRLTPPWCRETLAPVIPPIVGGLPQYLVVFVAWKDFYPEHKINVMASLRLPKLPGENSWSGHARGPGWSAGGKVDRIGSSDFFIFEVQLWEDDAMLEGITWEDVPMGPEFPWSSPMMYDVNVPNVDQRLMHVYC